MWFGWDEIYVDETGYPSLDVTRWKASAFILFAHVIYVGEVKPI